MFGCNLPVKFKHDFPLFCLFLHKILLKFDVIELVWVCAASSVMHLLEQLLLPRKVVEVYLGSKFLPKTAIKTTGPESY